MTWASMLYNADLLPGSKVVPSASAAPWPLLDAPTTSSSIDGVPCKVDHIVEAPGIPLAQRTKRGYADCPLSSAKAQLSPRKRTFASAPCEAAASDMPVGPIPCTLPQRPDTALLRTSPCAWKGRHASTIRSPTHAKSARHQLPTHLTAITNHGLYLPSSLRPRPDETKKPRSQDRIRAAQRLFHALGQSSRTDPTETAYGEEEAGSGAQSRMSFLYGLSAQAHRRNSRSSDSEREAGSTDMLNFEPTMHGTQQCVLATETGTFAIVVTPPSPRLEGEPEMQRVTGVRLTSHRTREVERAALPASTLQPPPFELAPGRSLRLAEQKRLALTQEAKDAAAMKALPALPPTPLRVQAAQRVPLPKMSPVRNTLALRSCHRPRMNHDDASRYIAPGRRRHMPLALPHSPMGRV